MANCFWKKNKAAEKWSAEEIERIFSEVYAHITKEENIESFLLINDVNLYLLTKYGMPRGTRQDIVHKIHNNNTNVTAMWEAIKESIEIRVVKDTTKLRGNIQSLVLQNSHNYKQKTEADNTHTFSKMPTIKRDGKKESFELGD